MLNELPNIGKELERLLISVGINNKKELEEVGAIDAWLRIQKIDSSACIHKLYALEGAIQGIKKTELSLEDKKYLKEFYNQHRL